MAWVSGDFFGVLDTGIPPPKVKEETEVFGRTQGEGWGVQARWNPALCQFSDQPENPQASSSSPEPSHLPGIPSKRQAVWEATGRG